MMPPLRQRRDDIPLLVNHFIAKFNQKIGRKIESVSRDTLNTLQEYHWPGNIRELESVIELSVITTQGTSLQVLNRFDTFKKTEEPSEGGVKALVEMERDHIMQVLKKTGWRCVTSGSQRPALCVSGCENKASHGSKEIK